MSLTYSTYITALSELMPVDSTNTDFLAILPDCIDYSELRIQRDLDLLQTMVRDSSAALSAGSRNFILPNTSGTFVKVDGINVITGSSNPDIGTRNSLVPVARDFLDTAWNSSSGSTVPRFFAMFNQTSIVLGPWPDNNYSVEVIGTQRFASLSATNTSNFLSTYFPDLLLAASMVFMSGFMKNFGAQADNPQMSQSWETQYGKLLASALTEENAKKFAGSGWTSESTGGPPAQPPRN